MAAAAAAAWDTEHMAGSVGPNILIPLTSAPAHCVPKLSFWKKHQSSHDLKHL